MPANNPWMLRQMTAPIPVPQSHAFPYYRPAAPLGNTAKTPKSGNAKANAPSGFRPENEHSFIDYERNQFRKQSEMNALPYTATRVSSMDSTSSLRETLNERNQYLMQSRESSRHTANATYPHLAGTEDVRHKHRVNTNAHTSNHHARDRSLGA